MNGKYMSGEYIRRQVLDSFCANKIEDVYKRREVNYQSVTNDTGEFYSEIIAEEILKNYNNLNKKQFENYLFPTRELKNEKIREYKIIHDSQNIKINNESKRNEENIAKRALQSVLISNNDYKVIDYQVPVNRIQYSKQGKVDLILRNDKDNILLLAELKDEKSQETLLRAVAEIKTYFTKIEANKDAFVRITESYKNNSEIKILPAVIFCNSEKIAEVNNDGYIKVLNRPKYEFNEMIRGKRPFLSQLCKACNIEFFELSFKKKEYCKDALGNYEKDEKGNLIRDYQSDQYTLTHLSY